MLDAWLGTKSVSDPAMADALAAAAGAIGRLDEALAFHPLERAFLHRARLDAVRRQAAVDGRLIDPWQLAAVLEGLRLRMDGELRIIDHGETLDAARHALTLHQWMVEPDFDQEGEVQRAARHLAGFVHDGGSPLLAAAEGMHAWLESNGTRPPIRAALIRFWGRHQLLRVPVPLTGAAALRAETPRAPAAWTLEFLRGLAAEATDARQLLRELERAWFEARASVAGRRRDSRVIAVVDLMAAVPLVSATTLARALSLAVKTAIGLLDSLVAAGVAVEVTHRAKRRMFGLRGLAPLKDAVRPPGSEPWTRPAATDCRGYGMAGCAAAAAHPGRANAVRLQRTRGCHGPCRAGDAANQTGARSAGPWIRGHEPAVIRSMRTGGEFRPAGRAATLASIGLQAQY